MRQKVCLYAKTVIVVSRESVTDFWARRHKTTLCYSLMVYSNNSEDTSPTRPNKA